MTCSLDNGGRCDDHSVLATQTDDNVVTDELDMKSYGTITFSRNYDNRANFIRISPNTSHRHIKRLFFDQNQIQAGFKRTSLVISIMGSAKESFLRSKLLLVFREGLLKIAKSTDIRIVTAGLNSRIAKFFGEIVQTNPDPTRPIQLMGFTSWGCVSGHDILDVQGTDVVYTKLTSDAKGEGPLEPNHTHFVFPDDGAKHKHTCAIQYRAQFERNLADDGIPVLVVVIEGCSDAIRKVHRSVVQDSIPVLLVEGTGGCCDLFAKCYHLYNSYKLKPDICDEVSSDESVLAEENELIKNKLRHSLRIVDEDLAKTSCTNAPPDGTDFFELIYECVHKQSKYLNFIDFKGNHISGDSVVLSILQALFKANYDNKSSRMSEEQRREQLYLAYDWKQIDFVKECIMIYDQDWKTIDLKDLFDRALLDDRADFLQLLLDHDFPLNEVFENNDKLLKLFENESFTFNDEINGPLRAIYQQMIQPMLGHVFQVDAIFDPDDQPTCNTIRSFYSAQKSSPSMFSEIDVNKELFLWAVVTGRKELALLFWTRGRNKICAAFMAVLIYKSKAQLEKDCKYLKWAKEMEQLAVEILERFYLANPHKCKQAIIRAVQDYDNVTWLQLAVMAESKLFIGKAAVQDVLTDIWYGCIDRHIGYLRLIGSSIIFPFSGFLPFVKKPIEEDVDSDESDNTQEQSGSFDPSTALTKFYIPNNQELALGCSSVARYQFDSEVNPLSIKNRKTGISGYFENLSTFLHAPCVKYLYNLYSYLIFLTLFSYVFLCDYHPLYRFQSGECFSRDEDNTENKSNSNTTTIMKVTPKRDNLQIDRRPSVTEIILIIWVFTLLLEEIRQMKTKKIDSTRRKLQMHFSTFWNKMDALSITLFFTACIIRFLPFQQGFCIARAILAVDLSLWFIRTLDVFSAVKRLGPKLVMIGEMMYDMSFFMLILALVILSFGVPTYSLLHGVEVFSWHIPRKIINLAYWDIFGEVQALDDIDKDYGLEGYVMFLLLVAYSTIASILLINLLIAMFSNTFEVIHNDADYIWKFQQYALVCYQSRRPLLPPPLIFVSHICRLIVYIFSHIFQTSWFNTRYMKQKIRAKFKIRVNATLTKQIEAIEDALGKEVYLFSLKTSRTQLNQHGVAPDEQEYQIQEIVFDKMKIFENRIQSLQHQQEHIVNHLQYLMVRSTKSAGNQPQCAH
ncbi:unnamed protein product [Adineta ricciae]|uniref:Uncharacterized protein n=1 Tax=Adineta ricciae TaxID=249248 RepID=A0A813MXW0_ADIRI|nr:unnamed protein product [Adineta ricciae]